MFHAHSVIVEKKTTETEKEALLVAGDVGVRTAKRILVVDDDLDFLKVVEELLQREGYDVWLAANGRAALDHVEEVDIDLIITDERMPVMTGTELITHLRGNSHRIPVIALTAYPSALDCVGVAGDGPCHCLFKPVRLDLLVQVVRSVLENR